MFVDDANRFFNHKDIKHLLTVVNKKLVNINDWFIANKLSLNMEKTKCSFFLKGYLDYITSQNVSSEAQIKNFLIS